MNRVSICVTVAMLAIFATMVAIAATYPDKARFMPLVVGLPAIGLCLLQLAAELRAGRRARLAVAGPASPRSRAGPGQPAAPERPIATAAEPDCGTPTIAAEVRTWAYFVAFIGGVLLFGFHVAVPVLVAVYLRAEAKIRMLNAVLAATVFTVAMNLMFERLLEFNLHDGFLTERLIDAFAL